LPDALEKRLPKWPLRLALSLVMVLEASIVVGCIAETTTNIPMLVTSIGLLVFCVLTWRGIPWSRWLLVAFLVGRIAQIGIAMGSSFAPGDHRIVSSLIMAAIYLAAGLLVASPLGRLRMRVNDRVHR